MFVNHIIVVHINYVHYFCHSLCKVLQQYKWLQVIPTG